MNKQNILVLGGTGKTGRKVAQRLTERGQPIRIGSRKEAPPFDWRNPETWSEVLEGMRNVYITFQPDLAVPGARETLKKFTAKAVENGVHKMVLLSGRGEKEAERCEQIIKDAGTNWTIIRSDWFNQNFSEYFFLSPILEGHLVLPKENVKIPFVDTDDIADVAVESLLNDKHNGKIYELTGPCLLTFKQAVTEISQAIERKITIQRVPLKEYKQILRKNQVPEAFIELMTYLFTEVLDGRNSKVTNDIEKVLGRPAKDFKAYTREIAKTDIWAVR